ncbi:MAG: hypothetical protein PHV34_21765 [Verrucomicrobiae bacterium]|nr:hypothetical protein [Verrucomicrobiae bacterium]
MKKLIHREKPYYPFLLGNGVDAVLVDYSGSMSCNSGHLHLEQHQGAICAWYKATQRERRKPLLPILQSSYTLTADGGATYEVGDFSQAFDPRKATLTTLVKATDFELEITSFLSREHLLVERYVVKNLPKDRPLIALNLHPPVTASLLAFPVKSAHVFSKRGGGQMAECQYCVNETRGCGVIYTDHPQTSQVEFWGGKRLVLSGLKRGSSFVKYLAVFDEKDDPDYKSAAARTIRFAKKNGFDAIFKAHQDEWARYQNRNLLKLPDQQAEYLYYLSLYLIRANQNLKTGLISLGNYPQLWGGGMSNSWDLIFPHTALLGANRIGESEKLIEGYHRGLPIARDYAKKIGARGAYYPWFMNYQGKSLDFSHPKEFPHIEKFNNGCLVMEVFNHYLFSGDRGFLEAHWDVIKETVDFLIAFLVEEKGNFAFIRTGEGADESIPRKNDTTHLLSTMKAIEALIKAGAVLNRKLDSGYARILAKLKAGLDKNFHGRLLMPFQGADRCLSAAFTFYLLNLPEGVPPENVEKALDECRGKLGLTNPGTYQNLIWPWTEFRAAAALAYLKDQRAFGHLSNGAKYTSSLGAFPEKIRPDGFPINYWFLSAHGTFVWALNAMLAHGDDRRLFVLPAIPDSWRDLEFRNLRVPLGLLVSLKMRKGKIERIVIENTSTQVLKRRVEIRSQYLGRNHARIFPGEMQFKPHEKTRLL